MTDPLRLRLRGVEVFSRQVRLRMPFRYGVAKLTEMPIAHLRATVEPEGDKPCRGVSACCLPPLWFDKDTSRTHADNIRELYRSLHVAIEVYTGLAPATPWDLHREAEPEIRRRLTEEGFNDLTAGFGVALVDAALIDAVCRTTSINFHEGLRKDAFGLGPVIAAEIPERPIDKIAVRHTVGMGDALTKEDLPEPLNDGLPETLVDVIRTYRPRYFKVKVPGDPAAALDRMRRVAEVLETEVGDYRTTLDGNELFPDMAAFAAFVRLATAETKLRNFWDRTLWVEQPVTRKTALHDTVSEPLAEINRVKPVIVDESDGTDDVLDRALALGYKGISAKNCKGIFRSIQSYLRLRHLKGSIFSSEDLVNVPVVPLHQDLCVAGALGIPHSERNGHHYIRAFKFLSPQERNDALREFPSLYREVEGDVPVLRVEDGLISLVEINDVNSGVSSEPDWESLEPVELP